ncbi:MAG: L,D-transpeptidase family protein [Pseudomonadota bacterium]
MKRRINKDLGKSHALPVLIVRRRPGGIRAGSIVAHGVRFHAVLGRSGCTAYKREGDGATPRGSMRIIQGYYRADRVRLPETQLRMLPIRRDLGWCDAPTNPSYNRAVRLPFSASHERMVREDRLYDICLVLDWNLTERRRYRGSAIFLHQTHPTGRPTDGCIAVDPQIMRRILPRLSRHTVVRVV